MGSITFRRWLYKLKIRVIFPMAGSLGKKKEKYSNPKLGPVERDWPYKSFERTYYYREDGGGQITVPVSKNGNIPKRVLVARFINEEEGAKPGTKKRSIGHDIATKSSVYETNSPQQWEWYRRPNKYDLKGIDGPKSNFFNSDASKGEPNKNIAIIGRKKDQEKIRKHLEDSFTKEERKKMRGLVIEVGSSGSAGRNAAGYYVSTGNVGGRKASDRQVRDIEYIKIGRDHVDDPKVVVHEVVHYMRNNDRTRKGGLKFRRGYAGTDKDFEEALTESETSVRVKKYKHEMAPPGYWTHVREQRDNEVAYPHGISESIDRDVFTKGRTRELHDQIYEQGKIVKEEAKESTRLKREAKGYYDWRKGVDVPPRKLTKEEQAKVDRAEANYQKLQRLNKEFIEQVEKSEGKKGKIALRKVRQNFSKSKISTLKLYNTGNTTEAIDTYYKIEDKDGVVGTAHVYSPNRKINQKEAAKEVFGTTKGVSEFRDGKAVPLEEGYLNSATKKRNGPGKGWHGERVRHRNAALKRRMR